ncbi:U3 small nucleolar ribonucleoprotein IMP3 [Heterocephalus glaber]|uniref:U3 small nucleolar ribonucleoprotein IMP3 n=1 Tax=Heterocephalus glaber TaxID=10181 RepID=G5ALG6_HETGA|nr:U3 small nucleolar ribonucleoprotein IMP3 [Heterocephalus glaber]
MSPCCGWACRPCGEWRPRLVGRRYPTSSDTLPITMEPDPSILIRLQRREDYTRMEDFVTWVDSSKIKRHVLEYNEERDDFDLDA